MTKTIIDYSNTIFYKLCCNDLNITDIYIGHTTNFRQRKSQHHSASKTVNYKVYQFIRDNGHWENWDMIQIEVSNCKDANEARARERQLIEELNATLNKVVPHRTKKEYLKDTVIKEKIKEQTKHYKDINQIKVKEKNKEYREKNILKIKENGREYQKKRRQLLKDKLISCP